MRMTLSTFKRLFEAYQESGLNVRDFCANQDIAPSSFYYWKKKVEDTPQPPPDNFVPLVFDSKPSITSRRTITAPIASAGISSNNAPIEFVFPNGTKMIFSDHVDMRLLKAVVHLFD